MPVKNKKWNITIILIIIIVFLLFLVIILNLVKNINKNEYSFGHSETSKIPNIIWTFWEGEPNKFVDKCILSWKNYNPNYKINIISKNNYRDYIDIDLSKIKHTNDSLARYSDYIRLCILSKYGGIWIDASIICHSPFTWINAIQNKTNCDTIGYYLDKYTDKKYINYSPIIESWFFACVPNSKFVNDWCTEFLNTANYDTIGDYVKNVIQSGVSIQKIDMPDYLAIHVAAQKVLQTNKNAYDIERYGGDTIHQSSRNIWQKNSSFSSKIILFSADNSPYKYLSDSNWDSKLALNKLMDENTKNYYYQYPIIKIRALERNIINDCSNFSGMFSM